MSQNDAKKQELVDQYEALANAYELELEKRQKLLKEKSEVQEEIDINEKLEKKLTKKLKKLSE